jgi:hypothetical protein
MKRRCLSPRRRSSGRRLRIASVRCSVVLIGRTTPARVRDAIFFLLFTPGYKIVTSLRAVSCLVTDFFTLSASCNGSIQPYKPPKNFFPIGKAKRA